MNKLVMHTKAEFNTKTYLVHIIREIQNDRMLMLFSMKKSKPIIPIIYLLIKIQPFTYSINRFHALVEFKALMMKILNIIK